MIGKITKQELHPSLWSEIEKAGGANVNIGISPIDNPNNGDLWFSLKDFGLYIYYEGEWHSVCGNCGDGGGGGHVPLPKDFISLDEEKSLVIIKEKQEKVETGFVTVKKDDIVKVFVNGLLLKEGLDFEYVDSGKSIKRIDGKDWGEENEQAGTVFLFVKLSPTLIDDKPTVKFLHEHVISEKDTSEVEIPEGLKEIFEYKYNKKLESLDKNDGKAMNYNTEVSLNKVVLDPNSYTVKDGKIIKEPEGTEWKISGETPLVFEFRDFDVDKDLILTNEDKDYELPKVSKVFISELSSKQGSIDLPLELEESDYVELYVNGIFVHRTTGTNKGDYMVTRNSIEKEDGVWNKGTTFFMSVIKDVRR